MDLTLKNRPEEKQRILPLLEAFAQRHHLNRQAVTAADLSLEEHITNVMSYAYEDSLPHEILIRFDMDGQNLVIEVHDDGRPHNPLSHPPVDPTVPLEEKPIGGLGVHLIRSVMDEVDYRRESGRNILRMKKRPGG